MPQELKHPVEILVADDDQDDYFLIEHALRKANYTHRISWMEDGEKLIEFLKQRKTPHYDYRQLLILLDLNMPKKDGREALREIKTDELLRRIPVIILTTSHNEQDIALTYNLGVNSFITKPTNFQDFIKAMALVNSYWMGLVKLPAIV